MSLISCARFLAIACAAIASPAALAQHDHHDHEHGQDKPAAPATAPHEPEAAQQRPSDPYPLATCPVSGKELGAMGDPVVKTYDGREVRFCCEGCIEDFEAKQADYWKKIDEQIVKDQLPYYPLSTCVISGEPLIEDGEDIGVNLVHRNRLVRFCCRDCAKEFLKKPEETLKKLDAATVQQQREHYPLATCVISSEDLGAMGEPYEVVIANRLVRLCCAMCEEQLRAEPRERLAALDEAWKQQGLPQPLERAPDAEHGDHGDAGHESGDGHDGHDHGDEHDGHGKDGHGGG